MGQVVAATAVLTSAGSDEQVVRLWLATVSPSSRRIYQSAIEEFGRAVHKPLADLRLEDLACWFQNLTGATGTKRRKQTTVKSLLSFCHRIGYLPFNVGGALPAVKMVPVGGRRILEQEQIWRIIDAVEEWGREVLSFLYETGSRASEVANLRWRDLANRSDGTGLVTVMGKGQRTRTVLLSATLNACLQARRGDPEDLVFQGPRGGRLDQPDLWKLVRRAARKAGIVAPVSAHWFRHASASHAIDGGAPLHLVQQQLGHSSLAVTGLYLHASPQDGLYRYLSRRQGTEFS